MSLLALLDCSTISLSAAILAASRGVAEAIDDATGLFFFGDAEL
jgi:hypothetical protein